MGAFDATFTAEEKRILDVYVNAFVDTFLSAEGILGEGDEIAATSRAVEFASARSRSVIAGIDETTRESIHYLVDQKIKLGWTEAELQEQIAALGLDEARALTIARTETWLSYNAGETEAWIDEGFLFVRISDGEDFDQPCIDADGQIWAIEEYLTHPLQHPNCQRQAEPIEPDEEKRLRANGSFVVSRPSE